LSTSSYEQEYREIKVGWFVMFDATFNNISVISWWSVLLEEETGVPAEQPPTYDMSLTNFIT
jgi:hypothetical protein